MYERSDIMQKSRESMVFLDFLKTYDCSVAIFNLACGGYMLYQHNEKLLELPILYACTLMVTVFPLTVIQITLVLSPIIMFLLWMKTHKTNLCAVIQGSYEYIKDGVLVFNLIMLGAGIAVFVYRQDNELAVYFIYIEILMFARLVMSMMVICHPTLYANDVYLQELSTELYQIDQKKFKEFKKEIKEVMKHKEEFVIKKGGVNELTNFQMQN